MAKLVKNVKRVQWFDDRFYMVTFADNAEEALESVTSILSVAPKDNLWRWRGMVGNEEADRRMRMAADRGTRIHNACYILANGGYVLFDRSEYNNPDSELRQQNDLVISQCKAKGIPHMVLWDSQEEHVAVQRFRDWLKGVSPEVLHTEVIVYSIEEHAAGTADMVCRIQPGVYKYGPRTIEIEKSGLWIVDYKSGRKAQDHPLQVAAYAKMWEESTGGQIEGTMVVYLDADNASGCDVVIHRGDEVNENYRVFQTVHALWKWNNPNTQPKRLMFDSILFWEGQAAQSGNFMLSNEKALEAVQSGKVKIANTPAIATAEDPEAEQIRSRVIDMVSAVYKTADKQMFMLGRAWPMKVQTFEDLSTLTLAELKAGMPTIENDYATLTKGKRK